MKILVAGCSFSTGCGFADSVADPRIWPNLLAHQLNGTVKNVARSGWDNTGIFLNAIEECTTTHYDLILIQVTALGRIVVSPSIHGTITLPNNMIIDHWKNKIDQSQHTNFCKHFTLINGDYEHWKRLIKTIHIVQNLVGKGYNIKFINGLLGWDKDFFSKSTSTFADNIIYANQLPDEELAEARSAINSDKEGIDLDLWINPFDSFRSLQVDSASSTDTHPGIVSQEKFSKYIFEYLQLNHQERK